WATAGKRNPTIQLNQSRKKALTKSILSSCPLYINQLLSKNVRHPQGIPHPHFCSLCRGMNNTIGGVIGKKIQCSLRTGKHGYSCIITMYAPYARSTPSIIVFFKFSMQTMQVRIRGGEHRWGHSLVAHNIVGICCTSLGPSTSQGKNQDRSINHNKQWQKPGRQGKPLFRWSSQNRFTTYIDEIL